MTTNNQNVNRRNFLKTSALASGGFMITFPELSSCSSEEGKDNLMNEWFELNGYIKIGDNGKVTIMSPNPEGGQNVKTSMPMETPVGERNDYDAARYAAVLELVRGKSKWNEQNELNRGVAVYYCHNFYSSQVLDLKIENGHHQIENAYCDVESGIVVGS